MLPIIVIRQPLRMTEKGGKKDGLSNELFTLTMVTLQLFEEDGETRLGKLVKSVATL